MIVAVAVALAVSAAVAGGYLASFKLWRFLGLIERDEAPACRVCSRPSASDVCKGCADGRGIKGGDYVNGSG